jgi:hypothetical protein
MVWIFTNNLTADNSVICHMFFLSFFWAVLLRTARRLGSGLL